MNIDEELDKPNPLVKLLTPQWFLDRYRMAMRDLEQDPFVTQLFSDYIGRYELKALHEFGIYTLDEMIKELQLILAINKEDMNFFNEMVAVLMVIDHKGFYTRNYDLCYVWFSTCS